MPCCGNQVWQTTGASRPAAIMRSRNSATVGLRRAFKLFTNVLVIDTEEVGELRPAYHHPYAPTSSSGFASGTAGTIRRYLGSNNPGDNMVYTIPAGYDAVTITHGKNTSYGIFSVTITNTSPAVTASLVDTYVASGGGYGFKTTFAGLNPALTHVLTIDATNTKNPASSNDLLLIQGAVAFAQTGTANPDTDECDLYGTVTAMGVTGSAREWVMQIGPAAGTASPVGGIHQGGANYTQTMTDAGEGETWTLDGAAFTTTMEGFTAGTELQMVRVSRVSDAGANLNMAGVVETYKFHGDGMTFDMTMTARQELKTGSICYAGMMRHVLSVTSLCVTDKELMTLSSGASNAMIGPPLWAAAYLNAGGVSQWISHSGTSAINGGDTASSKVYAHIADRSGASFASGYSWNIGWTYWINSGLAIAGGTYTVSDDIADAAGNPIQFGPGTRLLGSANITTDGLRGSFFLDSTIHGPTLVGVAGGAFCVNCIYDGTSGTVVVATAPNVAYASADIDGNDVPTKGGNCDVGTGGDPRDYVTANPYWVLGSTDARGQRVLDERALSIGGVYPQRDRPQNLLLPVVQQGSEIGT